MKRPVVPAVILFALTGLVGCPIYDHDSDGCYRDSDCGRSYVCDQHSGDCVLPDNARCTNPSDCDSTATCTPAGVCVPGDCTFSKGCVAGYRCDSRTGVWLCVANGKGAAGSSGSGEAGAVGEGGTGTNSAAGQGGQSVPSAGAADVPAGGVAGQ